MPEFEQERDAAEQVKRATPILVVIGNPPYNAYAGTSPDEEEHGLVEPYKEGLRETWGIKKYNLDDLYIRFFRFAERRIAEQTGQGVVCFISNYSWLSDPSFVVLRKHLLDSFDDFWVEDLHGNRKDLGVRSRWSNQRNSICLSEDSRKASSRVLPSRCG